MLSSDTLSKKWWCLTHFEGLQAVLDSIFFPFVLEGGYFSGETYFRLAIRENGSELVGYPSDYNGVMVTEFPC